MGALTSLERAISAESRPDGGLFRDSSMARRFVLSTGELIDYGYGLTFIDKAGGQAIGHGGGYHGFSGIGFHLPEDDVYVAVLSNNAGKQPNRTEVARQVASMVLGIQ